MRCLPFVWKSRIHIVSRLTFPKSVIIWVAISSASVASGFLNSRVIAAINKDILEHFILHLYWRALWTCCFWLMDVSLTLGNRRIHILLLSLYIRPNMAERTQTGRHTMFGGESDATKGASCTIGINMLKRKWRLNPYLHLFGVLPRQYQSCFNDHIGIVKQGWPEPHRESVKFWPIEDETYCMRNRDRPLSRKLGPILHLSGITNWVLFLKLMFCNNHIFRDNNSGFSLSVYNNPKNVKFNYFTVKHI